MLIIEFVTPKHKEEKQCTNITNKLLIFTILSEFHITSHGYVYISKSKQTVRTYTTRAHLLPHPEEFHLPTDVALSPLGVPHGGHGPISNRARASIFREIGSSTLYTYYLTAGRRVQMSLYVCTHMQRGGRRRMSLCRLPRCLPKLLARCRAAVVVVYNGLSRGSGDR